jgi:hypothetical protein
MLIGIYNGDEVIAADSVARKLEKRSRLPAAPCIHGQMSSAEA